MRVRRSFLNWGVFLVCLGLVPLAVRLGWISPSVATEIVRWWPLVLIAIGIGLLLRFTRFDVLGVILSAGTSGLLIGALLAGGVSSAAVGCMGGPASGPPQQSSGAAGPSMALSVELTCGEMDLNRVAGGDWSVSVVAQGAPQVDAGGTALSLRSAPESGFAMFGGRPRELWQVSVPAAAQLSAHFTINAAASRLHLGDGALSDVSATFNAADGVLDLGGATAESSISLSSTLNASSIAMTLPAVAVNGSITLNASTLELCVPPELGLRISYEETLSSNNFGQAGLSQSQRTWTSANFISATARTDLHITANVSTATVNPTGGCQ